MPVSVQSTEHIIETQIDVTGFFADALLALLASHCLSGLHKWVATADRGEGFGPDRDTVTRNLRT